MFPVELVRIVQEYIDDPLQSIREEISQRVEIGNSFAKICFPDHSGNTIFLRKNNRDILTIKHFLWAQ